jgi:2-dehydro-3-deoxyphosphogluconate aldolase/(4S)-4-hydroxy-2-oxoglutarate aldolase
MSTQQARLRDVFALAPVIPVITIEDAAQAVPLARALVKGGLRVVEITLRTQAGLDAARAILAEVPEAVVGIGTVLTPDDYERAAKLGAAFAISPGQSIELLDAAKAGTLPFAPGIQSASDLMACVTRSFELVKFFPAVPAGGLAAIDALAGPFPNVRFCRPAASMPAMRRSGLRTRRWSRSAAPGSRRRPISRQAIGPRSSSAPARPRRCG